MKVTLRQIEGFLAAADALSFSRAAQQSHVTQSAFSQLIRELELSLDVRLFDRTTRKVALTDSGQALLQKMRAGVAAIQEACTDAQAIRRVEKGHVVLGTLPSLAAGCVTQALGDLKRLHPGVTVSLHEAHNPDVLDLVLSAQVEFAICALTPSPTDLVFEPLFSEELVAVVRVDHALANKNRQGWKRLAGESLILMTQHSSTRHIIADALSSNGVDSRPAYEIAGLATALSMVKAGLGVTIMPMMALLEMNMEQLALCRLTGPTAARQIAICRRRDRAPSPAASKLAQLVRDRVKQLLRPGISRA